MSASAGFLKQMAPADPDRAAHEAKRFVEEHMDWVRGISVRSWEALRRIAPEATEYHELSGAFRKHLTESRNRATAGTGWGYEPAVSALKDTFDSARQVDASASGFVRSAN